MFFRPVCWSAVGAALLASALVLAAPPSKAPAPAAEKCGACHPLPPPTGAHAKHTRERVACADCHGQGFRDGGTDGALHQNGVTDLAVETGWNATGRSCANSCHGRETWPRSGRGGEQGRDTSGERAPADRGERGQDHHDDGDDDRHHDRDRDDDHRDHDQHRDRDHHDDD